jgi:hypothetical protein
MMGINMGDKKGFAAWALSTFFPHLMAMTFASKVNASPCIDPLTSADTLAVSALISCNSAEARSTALTASSPVTPVTLLMPFATAVSS